MNSSIDVALVQMMVVGAVGWLFYYLALASGQKPLADLLKVTTFFICISIGAGAIWELLNRAAEWIERVTNFIPFIGG